MNAIIYFLTCVFALALGNLQAHPGHDHDEATTDVYDETDELEPDAVIEAFEEIQHQPDPK